ncbi:MFS transporter [Sciscionella marina]|uniref:MFS transporter n=1 Tax=Sciscionella marina TaxID=508770 RepID=UPI0003A88743|nr:MFS transporter [Sciscionella marina]
MQGVTTQRSAGRQGRVLNARLLTLSLGFFVVIMDATIVNTANPTIGAQLHAGLGALQWVLDGYTLVFACLLLTGGSLADRFGARRVFLTGLLLFAVASAGCGLATDVTVLNLARVLQGIASAFALPSSLSLIAASFPDATRRARAIGIWGAVGGIAASTGPLAGGVLTGTLGWRPIFLINIPICLIAALLTIRTIPAPAPRAGVGFDLTGQLTLVLASAVLVFGLINGKHGWADPLTLGPIALGLAGFAVFGLVERRVRTPMFPLPLLGHPGLRHSLLVGCAINTGLYGILFVLTFFLQHTRNLPPLLAGLGVAPLAAITLFGSAFSGRAMVRFGTKPVLCTGVSLAALGAGWLAATAHAPYPALLPGMVLLGFGVSFTMPAATATAIGSVPAERAGLASGALNASRQFGSAIGVAVLGSLSESGGMALAGIAGALALLLAVPSALRAGRSRAGTAA